MAVAGLLDAAEGAVMSLPSY